MTTLTHILSRTSYRGKYTPDPVPREHMQQLLEAGIAAPSGCNKQTTSLIAAVSLGYESCWVEGHITDANNIGRQMADVLGVPEDYELICYLPIGKAAEPTRRPKKKPFSERAWFNGFGRKE